MTDSTDSAREPERLQDRVAPWMEACFGPEISNDKLERGDRFLEEALELLQSGGYPPERVAALTGYVFNREVGEPAQEVGGVMITLAAYCLAHGLNMHEAGETELARIWTKVDKIRAKQAAKPVGSALPVRADLALDPLRAVKVKPLEWGGFRAGPYWIEVEAGGLAHLFCDYDRTDEGVEAIKGGFLTLVSIDDLKAAAQADYETRIRSALEPCDPLADPRVKALIEFVNHVADGQSKDYTDNCDRARALLAAFDTTGGKTDG